MTIDEMLARARARLSRVGPDRARALTLDGAGLLVDIRPEAQRRAEGEVPGSLILERNVLEWRLDPTSDAAIDVASRDLIVVVMCQEGYTSSLAAAALQDLGILAATDMIGGFAAWREAGLPVRRGGTPAERRVTA